MDDGSENSGKSVLGALWRALRPALPAVIAAAAMTFLLGAVMPMSWVAGISWNLYLDRLADLFVPPVGNGGRLALALGMALFAAILAGFVALLATQPVFARGWALRRTPDDDDVIEDLPRRRRADLHPDDPPRAPIRAGRDLPAEGLGPIAARARRRGARTFEFAAPAPDADDELMLGELAPAEPAEAFEPWLQPAELTLPISDIADRSLGAMVARFEVGLARRRQVPAEPEASLASEEAEPEVDFALEAALSTLQRLSHQAVG